MIDDMVYKVPPYNDELDTCEADDSYDYGERVFKKAEAQMQEAYASIKRIKGVSYRSSRLSNCIDSNKKYYVIFREDYDPLTQSIYVEADSPSDAIIEARLVEWLSFKGNSELTFQPELPFDLISVIKGWPEDVTPIDPYLSSPLDAP